MDGLLLLAAASSSIGYTGRGDFAMAADGALRRRDEREVVPFIYAGAAILAPALFAKAPPGRFSLNLLFDRAIASGRLHGLRLEGTWMHVGTPEAVGAAEAAIAESENGGRTTEDRGEWTTGERHRTHEANCGTVVQPFARLS
jgi:MurNAc alpha-1-phosphate uridylyltransferase